MGGCPGAWLAHMTGDSTHTHNFLSGLVVARQLRPKCYSNHPLKAGLDKSVNGSSRQFLRSDFSYQKITTTAVTVVLRLGRRATGGWGMAAACSISLCRNNVAPYKGLPC